MIEDRIQKIEARIQSASHLAPESKTELLDLLESLRKELGGLNGQASEKAAHIAELTETSTHEATKEEAHLPTLERAIHGLNQSVEEFEVTHPDLSATLNRIAVILSNMGM